VLTTDQKGAAEAAIAHAALELGVAVSRPLGDQRYDLIFDVGRSLLRVQCKWASRDQDVIVVRCYSSRRTAGGLVRRVYRSEEVDAFAAYCADVRAATSFPSSLSRPVGRFS
jgi:PD-(D/E)XK endonuclease